MIERYALSPIKELWSEENKFNIYLKVELTVCEVFAQEGFISNEEINIIKENIKFDIKRIKEIEKQTHHDIIAFLTNLAEEINHPASRFLHYGMTSSDLLDTSLALLLKEAGELLLDRLIKLQATIKKQALKHKYTIMIGRSHGVHAEPITWGLTILVWYAELERHLMRLRYSIENISYGKISGAVGTFSHLDPKIEMKVCQKLDLKPAPISTQIIQRDRHSEFMQTLALIASSLEKFALEIRHLQSSEILEVEE